MALNIDTSKALRRPSDLRALVEAVVAAAEADEADWVEWKTELDLGRAEGRIHVARPILGFANRTPSTALRHCMGVGYLIVGAAPGNLCGTEMIDPADLDAGLSPYLGNSGPIWSPQWIEVEGKTVLVVAVEAPQEGDRMALLRREGPGGYQQGTVFVRKRGRTVRADDADMEALQDRLLAGRAEEPNLEVVALTSAPLRWFDSATTLEMTEAWIARRTEAMLQAAEDHAASQTEPQPADPPTPQELADELTRKLDLTLRPAADHRSLADFQAEIEAWAGEVRESVLPVLLGRIFTNERNLVRFRISNCTDLNLHDLEVKLHFPGDAVEGFLEEPDRPALPTPPRAYGEPTKTYPAGFENLARTLNRMDPWTPGLSAMADIGFPKRTWIEDGSVRVVFHAGDMRPREVDESDEVWFLLTEPSAGALTGTWEATSKNWDGVMAGDISIQVEEAPLRADDLLDNDH